MKSTGIVRKVDSLGRMVIPIELRRTLEIETKDPLEIYVENDKIILQKYEPACTFCDNTEDTKDFKGKIICSDCLESLSSDGQSA